MNKNMFIIHLLNMPTYFDLKLRILTNFRFCKSGHITLRATRGPANSSIFEQGGQQKNSSGSKLKPHVNRLKSSYMIKRRRIITTKLTTFQLRFLRRNSEFVLSLQERENRSRLGFPFKVYHNIG